MKNNFNISHHSVDTANSKATIRAIDNLINFETIKPKNLLNEKDYKDTKNKKTIKTNLDEKNKLKKNKKKTQKKKKVKNDRPIINRFLNNNSNI